MVFPSEIVRHVLAGKVTARVVPLGSRRRLPRPGDIVPVGAGTVVVSGVARTELAEVASEVAEAAGFDSLDDFFADWRRRHRNGPLMRVPVAIVRFVPYNVLADRYLRPGPRGGYTEVPSEAMEGEPACVPEEWQDAVSAVASRRDHLMRIERVAAARQERWRFKRQRRRTAAAMG